MAEQLSILGLWERVPEAERVPEPPAPPPAPPPPVDPRQVDLLSGAQVQRSRLEDACATLDGSGLRAAHAELNRRFLAQGWAARAPDWADSLDAFNAAPTPEAMGQRALDLLEPARSLPDAPRTIVRAVQSAATTRAAQALIAAKGPAARLGDGRPAAVLPLLAGDAARAQALLREACDAHDDAQWCVLWAQAADQAGDAGGGARAWCRACVLDPAVLDAAQVDGEIVLALLDEADELELPEPMGLWLPVLADLHGVVLLEDVALRSTNPAVVALRRYRVHRRELDEAARIAAKRELSRLLPAGLRGRLRAL